MTEVALPADAALTDSDQELVRGVAAMLTDVLEPLGAALAAHAHQRVPELPGDEQALAATRKAAEGSPRELLSMLRANLPPSAHETPAEAIDHVRFLQRRGVGLNAVNDLYRHGFSMFRHVLLREVAERAEDDEQARRVRAALDAYAFAFVAKLTNRFAAEYGLTEGGWVPSAGGVDDRADEEAARRLREVRIHQRDWLPASVQDSRARQEAERSLRRFADTLLRGADEHRLHARLRLADTTVGITLADEPDLSVTLHLDREPIAVTEGLEGCEARMWIASVDLNRVWLPHFYLPMAVAKERVLVEGPIRKFLRVAPILRELGEFYEGSR